MNDYDPRAHGAKCDVCPLKDKMDRCVPPERGSSINTVSLIQKRAVAIVGEAPGEQEERQGRPFVGPSGKELDHALGMASIDRRDALVTNVLLCRPPGNKLREFLKAISKQNREKESAYKKKIKEWRKGAGPKPRLPALTPSPLDCCRPRLEKELSDFAHVITLGGTALRAVTGDKASVLRVRGGLMELDSTARSVARKVMPTLHPAFCLRQPRWLHVFRNDVLKASRWFRGETEWSPPHILRQPSPDRLRAFLEQQSGQVMAFDIETDGIEPLSARIRCISIGVPDKVVVLSFLSKDGVGRPYVEMLSHAEEREAIQILCEYFENEKEMKYGWNSITYDSAVLKAQWGCSVNNHLDGILLHRSVESELPHGLGYVGSMYTDAPSWKTDREGNKLATSSESDEDLATYCAYDVGVTARVLAPLVDQVGLRDQMAVVQSDLRVQHVCKAMHEVGMYVDQAKRLHVEKELLARRHTLLSELRDRIGNDSFNPGSVYQVRDILFDKWNLEVPLDDKERLTSSDDPSTADIVLRALLTSKAIDKEKRQFIKTLRYYRKIQKVLGTYVVKLRPWDMAADVGWDDDDDWVDKETRERYGDVKRGIVDPRTGRMHPGWSASVAVTGRLSSSKPINAMNFPHALRGMVTARPGHVLVGADADQLEIRVAASIWQIEKYLLAFREGKDPHSMTAFLIFGEAFCKAAGIDPRAFESPGMLVGKSWDAQGTFVGKGEAKSLRKLAKAVHFASQYMASVDRVHKMIQSNESPNDDGTTELPYATLELRRVRKMHDKWMKGAPEYQNGWDRDISEWKDQGYLVEPVGGRRRDFLDSHGGDEAVNELVNFKVQGGAAGWMNKAILEIYEQIPEHKWGPGTGIINQCHDHIVVECPESEALWVSGVIERAMNGTHPGLPDVELTASADIGPSWDKV
jgi:DNA polymerase I-like protein with 3'-5' exonuclease and polymerase domains/uracil-DNA glycosylase